MYKTFSSIVLNRFEALNLRLLSQIANVKPKPRPSIPVPAGIERAGTPRRAGTPGAEGDDPMEGRERAGTPAAAQTPGGAGAGGKKKKKGKR
jgi:signal recognition particle subunit SRP9